MNEKIQTSLYLEFHLRKKLKRVSKILEVTESSVMEDALRHYFSNSKVIQEAQKKIVDNLQFLENLALSFIALTAGGELKFNQVKAYKKSISYILVSQMIIIFFGMVIIFYVIGGFLIIKSLT